MESGKTIFAFCFFLLLLTFTSTHKCRRESGEEVTWYVALRIPNSRNYMIYEPKLKRFRHSSEEILAAALTDLSLDGEPLMLWNDQPVDKKASSSKAHAKGILHFANNTGGYVMVHSIPQFVDTSNGTLSPKTRETSSYGQSVVCVSLSNKTESETIIDHLMAENANIYADTFNSSKRPKPKNDTLLSDLPYDFKLATKTSISEDEVFEEFLVNTFKTGWLANTWGRPYTNSTCDGKQPISNVKVKSYDGEIKLNTQDHSKWALSYGTNQTLVCIGDMNHMDSQAKRGGSFVCRDDKDLYKAMYQMILEDECSFVNKTKSPKE